MPDNDIAAQFRSIVKNYSSNIKKILDEESEELGKESTTMLKGLGRYTDRRKREGYRKSFRVDVDRLRYSQRVKVYNKQWQLTHLLEYGHLVDNGTGRNSGKERTEAFPHWQQTEAFVNEEYPERVVKRIKALNGG